MLNFIAVTLIPIFYPFISFTMFFFLFSEMYILAVLYYSKSPLDSPHWATKIFIVGNKTTVLNYHHLYMYLSTVYTFSLTRTQTIWHHFMNMTYFSLSNDFVIYVGPSICFFSDFVYDPVSNQGLHCLSLIQLFLDTISDSKLYFFNFRASILRFWGVQILRVNMV